MVNRKSLIGLPSNLRKILFSLSIFSSFILHPSSFLRAQHTRLYACALASDEPGAFMGGSSMGAGLWQSDDTAKTWKQVGWKHVKCYSVDVVQKSNGKIIYQACGNGVLRSKDGGLTWRMLTDWRITEVLDIAIDQKAPENIYIATPYAIWKSMDAGETWFEADSDIPFPIFVSRIIIDPKNHLKIYAAIDSAIFISNDGGLQWVNAETNVAAVHNFVVDDMTQIAGVDSIGLLEWGDTNTIYINHSNNIAKNLYYHIADFDPASVTYFRVKNGEAIDVRDIPEFQKNIHSIVKVGNTLLLASLDGGIWKNHSAPDIPERVGLDLLQIWRLKAVEIR